MWNNFIEQICNGCNISNDLTIRIASFQTLGYFCEEINLLDLSESLNQYSDTILNTINLGLGSDKNLSLDIRYTAMICLKNSLGFIAHIFQVENFRNLIFDMIFNNLSYDHLSLRLNAFQCLVTIADLYYDYLTEDKIGQIYHITELAIKEQPDDIICQAIEFWSVISDTEIAIKERNANTQKK